MARDFDGTNDNLAFGSDASIDAFTTQSIAMWVQQDTTATFAFWVGKDRFGVAWGVGLTGGSGDNLSFAHQWSGAAAEWAFTDNNFGTGIRHLVITYDGSSTSNNPAGYFNNVVQPTINVVVAPSGTLSSDAAANLRCGETGANGGDFNGRIACLNYYNGILSSDERNRAMWWGKARGDVQVYHPFWTTKLGNEGTAVAAGTASGTTVTNSGLVVPVVRPGTAQMGLGVGW